METVVERPAALDVRKQQVTACVRVPGKSRTREEHVAEFKTTVQGLLALRDWRKAHGVIGALVCLAARGLGALVVGRFVLAAGSGAVMTAALAIAASTEARLTSPGARGVWHHRSPSSPAPPRWLAGSSPSW